MVQFMRSLARLWRHPLFRRLLAVRVAAQSSDGLLQVALASFVLFNPQRQPDAAAIAVVLAVTLLPFSILGPFVSVVLDRWSRRQVLLTVDLIRSGIVLIMAGLATTGVVSIGAQVVFYTFVLLAMSLNRFVLAALSAALPHTLDEDEYLVANAVVPVIGPAGALVGGAVGAVGRIVLGGRVPAAWADAVLFTVAAGGFLISATMSGRIGRRQLGPDDVERGERRRAGDVFAGLVAAVRHLIDRSPAGLGLLTIFANRLVFGVVTVAMILVFRLHFHRVADVNAALGDLALYGGFTGAGFVLASAVTPPLARAVGARWTMIGSMLAAAVFQVVPGAIFSRWPLMIGGFLLGVAAQCVKIAVDTLVQAHVDDDYKGRVFVLYDMVFNLALVISAGITAAVLPADGASVLAMVILAVGYLVVALAFGMVSGRVGSARFDRGGAERPRTSIVPERPDVASS